MLAPDNILGKYRIIKKFGAGGMADVYQAEDTSLGRQVALKVLPPAFARDADLVRWFEKEVRAAAVLHHPTSSLPSRSPARTPVTFMPRVLGTAVIFARCQAVAKRS